MRDAIHYGRETLHEIGVKTVAHFAEHKLEAYLLSESAKRATARMAAGAAMKGLAVGSGLGMAWTAVEWLRFVLEQVHNAHAEGRRNRLSENFAEGMARVLSGVLSGMDKATLEEYIAQGRQYPASASAAYRDRAMLAAYDSGIMVAKKALACIPPSEYGLLREALLEQMPGWRSSVKSNPNNASVLKNALIEYLGPARRP